ncbi:MAG TPA: WD40 repeat domain-containing protein [Fimbriimonas sp.]
MEPTLRWALPVHSNTYTSVVPSPDGQLLATTSYDNTLRVWHLPTRTLLYSFNATEDLYGASFSPNGQWIALSHQFGYVSLVHAFSGATAWKRLGAYPTTRSVFSRDGSAIFFASNEGYLDAYTLGGFRLFSASVAPSNDLHRIALSPRGDLLAVGGEGLTNDVKVYLRVSRNGAAKRTLSGLKNFVRGLGFSGDGKFLFGVDSAGNVQKWNVTTNDTAGTAVASMGSVTVYDAAVRSNASHAVVCASDATLRLVQLSQTNVWDTVDLGYRAWSANFASNGVSFFAAGEWHSAGQYDLATHAFLGALSQPYQTSYAAAWDVDGSRLAYGDYNGEVQIVDASLGRSGVAQTIGGHTTAMAWSKGSGLVAAGNSNKQVHVYDTGAEGWRAMITRQAMGGVTSLSFSPDGAILASGGNDDGVWIWDVSTAGHGTLKYGPLLHPADVTAVAYNSDGKTLASGDANGNVNFWNGATYAKKGSLVALGSRILDLAYATNPETGKDKYLGVALGSKVAVYRPTSGNAELIREIAFPAPDNGSVVGFGFTPDTNQIVMASSNGVVYFMSITGNVICRTIDYGTLYGISFSPTGEALAILTGIGVQVVGCPTRSWLGSFGAYSYGATGGSVLPMLVRLSAPAPSGGATVTLSSSYPGLKVPTTVYLPAGYEYVEVPVGLRTVARAVAGTVTASYQGKNLTCPVSILPPYVAGLSFDVGSVTGGGTVVGTVHLAGPAPSTGMTVGLKGVKATVPPTVVVPAGESSVSFDIATGAVAGATVATVTATTLQVQQSGSFLITP